MPKLSFAVSFSVRLSSRRSLTDCLVNIAMALATGYRAKAQMHHLNFSR